MDRSLENTMEQIENRIRMLKDDPGLLNEEEVKRDILNYLIDDEDNFEA